MEKPTLGSQVRKEIYFLVKEVSNFLSRLEQGTKAMSIVEWPSSRTNVLRRYSTFIHTQKECTHSATNLDFIWGNCFVYSRSVNWKLDSCFNNWMDGYMFCLHFWFVPTDCDIAPWGFWLDFVWLLLLVYTAFFLLFIRLKWRDNHQNIKLKDGYVSHYGWKWIGMMRFAD